MSGPVEEAGKAASSFIDALKAQPLSLALVVMNMSLLAYMFYWASAVTTARQESVRLILEVEKQVHELLSRCVVPPSPQQRSEGGSQFSGDRSGERVPLPMPKPMYPVPGDER